MTIPNHEPPEAESPLKLCPTRSLSTKRPYAERCPLLLFHGRSIPRTATIDPIPAPNIARRSRPWTGSNLAISGSSSTTVSGGASSPTTGSRASGVRVFFHAAVILLNNPALSDSSGCVSRSRTTATMKKASPPEPARAISWLAMERYKRRPNPPAPIIAAIPSIDIARSRV